jgi:hypothetical protein
MSGHPQGGHYDDGYGQNQAHAQQGQDGYYHDDQYGQYHDDARGQGQYQQQGDAYYDESCVMPSPRRIAATANRVTGPIMTDSSNRTATTTSGASRDIKTSIITISTMTRAVHKTAMRRTGESHLHCSGALLTTLQRSAPPPCSRF